MYSSLSYSKILFIRLVCVYIKFTLCLTGLCIGSLIRLLSLFEYMLDESGTAENKVELLFSHDKLLLASILRPLHQVTEEMLV